MFWMKSLGGTFKALQKKYLCILVQIFFELHACVKSAILAIFQKGLVWPCLVSAALKNCIIAFEKFLFVLGADEYLERLEGKIRKCLFLYVKIF